MSNLQQSTQEIWKPIPTLEGLYEISSHGRVRSLDHYVYQPVCKSEVLYKGRILRQNTTKDGYKQLRLSGGCKMSIQPHRMMWLVFNGEIPEGYEVDHIDNNKENNVLSNLQLLKSRHNSAKRSMNLKKTSRFTGVSWSVEKNKWQAHIRINGKSKSLGRYDNEIDASIAYQNALKQLIEEN